MPINLILISSVSWIVHIEYEPIVSKTPGLKIASKIANPWNEQSFYKRRLSTLELTFDVLSGKGGNCFTRTIFYFFMAAAVRLLNLQGNFSANYTQWTPCQLLNMVRWLMIRQSLANLFLGDQKMCWSENTSFLHKAVLPKLLALMGENTEH